jgi:PHD/YefM family antitoxin component YafN of YafNO toxin-antitoxin module
MTESSFDKIKKLIKVVGGKVIIVEDGKPTMVIINIDEYVDFEKTENDVINNPREKEIVGKVDKINKDINMWKNRQEGRMLRQIEIENEYRKRMNLENAGLDNNDEIVIKKL